eukprot:g6076.t1
MASTSNSFDALQNDSFVTISKKKRRNKKSASQSTDTNAIDGSSTELQSRLIPSSKELETVAASAVTEKTRLELWQKWTTQVREEETFRRGSYTDSEGKPIFFRKALIASRAFEVLMVSCLSSLVDEEQGNCLYHLLTSVFTSVEADILQQLVYAVVKASALCQRESSDVVMASKRALSEVVAAVKKADVVAAEGFNSQWKKRNTTKQERNSTTEKQVTHFDKKKEMNDALETLKTQQLSIDDVGDESMEGLSGAAAIRSIADLRFSFSLNRSSVDQSPSSKKGKKNKGKNTNSEIEILHQEDANLAVQENRLVDEISDLETQLQKLRIQLDTVQSSRQLIRQKKEALVPSTPHTDDPPVVLNDDQKEVISGLEGVISEIQSAAGLSDDQKSSRARSYVEAMEKYFSICDSRQDEIHKSMKFLRESLIRRLKQEETMREISSGSVAKDLIKSQKNSRLELESQIKAQLFESGDLIIKLDRVVSDLKFRASFVERYTSKTVLSRLEDTALALKQRHAEIKAESELRKDPSVNSKDQEGPQPRRRIDVQKLVEEEGLKVRQEIAAKLEPEQHTSHNHSSNDDSRRTVTSSPLNGGVTQSSVHQLTPSIERVEPELHQSEIKHPSPPGGYPVQQETVTGGTQSRRRAWKTVGPAAQVDSSFPALPSPGERK